MQSDTKLLLGEIKGRLDSLSKTVDGIDSKVGRIDDRVRTLETRAAGAGAIAGTFVSVGIAFLTAKLKNFGV